MIIAGTEFEIRETGENLDKLPRCDYMSMTGQGTQHGTFIHETNLIFGSNPMSDEECQQLATEIANGI